MAKDVYRGTIRIRGKKGKEDAIVVINDASKDVCQKVVQLITGEYDDSTYVHRRYTHGEVFPIHNHHDIVFDTHAHSESSRFGPFPKLPDVTLTEKQLKRVKHYQTLT